MIASGSADTLVILWDAKEFVETAKLIAHTE
jgi:hypothetical protein